MGEDSFIQLSYNVEVSIFIGFKQKKQFTIATFNFFNINYIDDEILRCLIERYRPLATDGFLKARREIFAEICSILQ
jgi:hypothetical protein